jgi:hypothetical protein
MSTLTINNTFSPEIFTFEMLPPYVVEKQHEIQNGNLLTDIIAYKDQFQIIWPWLSQTEYNSLMTILYSLTDPYLTVEYVTDSLTRIWDSSTTYSPVSAYFSGTTEVYDEGGILVEKATTNLFKQPSGEYGATTYVEGEDSDITVTNSSDVSLFGIKSYKVENSGDADYENYLPWWDPGNEYQCTIRTDLGRSGWLTSGTICVDTTTSNKALHTSDDPNDVVWTYSNCNNNGAVAWPIKLQATSIAGYLEQSIGLAGYTVMSLQCRFNTGVDGVDYDSNATVRLEIRDSAGTSVLASKDIALSDSSLFGNVQSVLYVPGGGLNTYRLRIYPDVANGTGYVTISEVMLCNRLYATPAESFVPTEGSISSVPWAGLQYELPKATWAYSAQSKSLQQSVCCYFKPRWDYGTDYNTKFVLFSDQNHTGGYSRAYFYNQTLKVEVQGTVAYSHDVSSWSNSVYHHIAIIQNMVNGSSVLKIYIDFVLVSTYDAASLNDLFLGNTFLNQRFSIGETWDGYTGTAESEQFDGYISEFYIGPWAFDMPGSRTSSALDIISQDYSESGDYNITTFVQKNEDISFFVRGNSKSAYIARCVFLKTDDATPPVGSGSCYVYPYYNDKSKVYSCGYDDTYFNDSYNWGLTSNLRAFTRKAWTRVYAENLAPSTAYYLFGVIVPIGDTFYLDGIQYEEYKSATTYCDGNQDNCAWSGTDYNSNSTRANQYFRITIPTEIYNTYNAWSIVTTVQMPSFSSLYSLNDSPQMVLALGDGTDRTLLIKAYKDLATSLVTEGYISAEMLDDNGSSISFDSTSFNTHFIRGGDYVLSIVRDESFIKIYINGLLALTANISNRLFKMTQYIYF